MSRRTVYRYEVPVDDFPHNLDLSGPIVHVDCRQADKVEVWAEHDDGIGGAIRRTFLVIGTGHALPDGEWRHVGTALAPGGFLVWHLYEVVRPVQS